MSTNNPCQNCIGKSGTGMECCNDVFLILNSKECHLFRKYLGFIEIKEEKGAVYYTNDNCPYLNEENECLIHDIKPLYCKYYPIFITGVPYNDDNCPASIGDKYILTRSIEEDIEKLQNKYPIYQREWLWEDVQLFYQTK